MLSWDKCADLLPDHFSFVRGMVDTADLSLNISREMLQHDRHLKAIAQSLEKKIKNELLKMQKDKPEVTTSSGHPSAARLSMAHTSSTAHIRSCFRIC